MHTVHTYKDTTDIYHKTYIPSITNIDIIDTIYINTHHTIHYVTFVYLSALTY